MSLIFRVMVIPMIALILPISGAQAHSAKAHKNTKSAAFQISNMTIQITHNPESSYPATIEFDVRPNSDKPFPADAGVDILLLDYQRKFIGQGGVTQFSKNADGSDVTPNLHPVAIRASASLLPTWAGEARGCVA